MSAFSQDNIFVGAPGGGGLGGGRGGGASRAPSNFTQSDFNRAVNSQPGISRGASRGGYQPVPTGSTPRPRPSGFGGQGAYNNRAPIGRPSQTPTPPRVPDARPFTQPKSGSGNRGTRGSGFQQLMRENGVTSTRGLRGGRGFGGSPPRPQATATPPAPNADQPIARPRTQSPRSPLNRIPPMGLPGNPLRDVGDKLPYPGQFPYGGIGNGPMTDAGQPAVPATPGSVDNALYRIDWTQTPWSGFPVRPGPPVTTTVFGYGPVTRQDTGRQYNWPSYPARFVNTAIFTFRSAPNGAFTTQNRTIESTNNNGLNTVTDGTGTITRADGGTDPPAQPEIVPTYAPNPIRGRISPNAIPDILPQVPDFFPSPTTWPNRPANPSPAKQPLPYIPTGPSPIRPDQPDEYVNDPDAPATDPTRPQFNPDGTPKTGPGTGTGLGRNLSPSKLGQGLGASSSTGRGRQRDQIVVPIVLQQGQTQPPETPVDKLTGNNFRPNTGDKTKIEKPPVVQIPPGAPTGPRPPGTCLFDDSRILARVKDVHDGIGIDDLPVSVPDQIAKQNPAQKTIPTLTALQLWQVEQLDGVMGRWPQQIGFPTPAGNVNVGMPNVSEAIAEIVGMLLSQQVTASQILHTSSRTLAQAGSATQQAHLAHLMSKANAEFMGYEGRPSEVEIPLAYSPGSDPGEGLLQESRAKIKGWQNTDGTDMKAIFAELLHAASIIRAVFWRRVNPREDFQQQIKDRVQGQSDFTEDTRQSPTNDNDWEQYLKDIEEGFRKVTGDSSPYGRNPSEGPKIRDISPEDGG